jgi:DNA-binding NtrC family response regulator
VRELRNFVQRASIFSDADVIETLPPPIMEELSNMVDLAGRPRDRAVRHAARGGRPQADLGTIAQCGGVKAQAAEVLDVSLKTIYNRLAQLEGEVEKPDS